VVVSPGVSLGMCLLSAAEFLSSTSASLNTLMLSVPDDYSNILALSESMLKKKQLPII
jgi:hypothetical protein